MEMKQQMVGKIYKTAIIGLQQVCTVLRTKKGLEQTITDFRYRSSSSIPTISLPITTNLCSPTFSSRIDISVESLQVRKDVKCYS